ncbi:MAG: acetate--CoA ligase [Ottowia sp.]|nr:acetate--CoA ligase [Ottowia sp.]
MPIIEPLLNENRIFHPSVRFAEDASISSMSVYHTLCQEAAQDSSGFWARLAREQLYWKKAFTKVLDESNAPFYKWFEDGITNVAYNCLDRHIENGHGDKTAIIFESDDGKIKRYSYHALYLRVCKVANGLRSMGIGKGDRVVIYMPVSVEAVIAMQACARIGAIHSVVFAGFSARSLYERIVDLEAVLIITADEQVRGGKSLSLKAIVDEALSMDRRQLACHVLVYQRTGAEINWHPTRDSWFHELEAKQVDICEPEWVGAEHPLFVLYTSGSTGKPKGVQHATAGYLLWSIVTMKWVFDIKANDIFWCTADIGWITGHSYGVYGPLAAGTTTFLFEGTPTYPDAGRFWDIIARHKISIFYTAPTVIRSLIKATNTDETIHPYRYDLSSLRLLGSVGEPINPEAWMWYYQQVGRERCPIVDTFWQTETGGHMIAPLPGATPLVPGSCTLPLPGIVAAIVDEFGHDLAAGQGGILVIKRPWPAMIRTLWGDPERFKQVYFPEELGGRFYLAGDGAICSKETGYFMITGRVDDLLNVSGHRMGTMEIESVLVAHPLVAEAAVVSRPDEITGEAIVAFVVLKRACPNGEEAQRLANTLREWVGKELSLIAKPKEIRFGDNLPKTRSGKIMRRLLRALARGEPITQDTSTLDNPTVLEQLKHAQ